MLDPNATRVMANTEEAPADDAYREWLLSQRDYFQYLFEQEQKRMERITGGAKVYIGILVFMVGSIFLALMSPDKILLLLDSTSVPQWWKLIAMCLAALSALALVISLSFSLLILKVWRYDRLCDPEERFEKCRLSRDQNEVLARSLFDFAIATNRNNLINNSRVNLQSYALVLLLAGSLLALVAGTIIDFIV